MVVHHYHMKQQHMFQLQHITTIKEHHIPYYYYTPRVTYVYKHHYVKPNHNVHHKPIKPNSHGVNKRPNNKRHR